MTFKIQVVFNNQKWSNELKRLNQAKSRIEQYSRGKIKVEFYPTIYTAYKEIPAVVEMFPFTNETAENIDPIWYQEKIYSQNPRSDALIFITNKKDWWDKNMTNGSTYGYCRGHHPATFPHFICIMAEPMDKSWKFSDQYALEHYIPHELGHAFCNITGIHDKTHEFDYQGKIQELYDSFDYDKIEAAINNKRDLNNPMYAFQRRGDTTLYMIQADKLVPVASSWENLKADFPGVISITIEPDEWLKFKTANKTLFKDR